jgi:hypothetical protein
VFLPRANSLRPSVACLACLMINQALAAPTQSALCPCRPRARGVPAAQDCIIHVESGAVRLEADEEDEEVDYNGGAMAAAEGAQPLRAEVEGPADGPPNREGGEAGRGGSQPRGACARGACADTLWHVMQSDREGGEG